MNGWIAVPGVGAGNGDVGTRGFEGVDWIRGGGVEGDDFTANGQVIAVGSSAYLQDTFGAGPPTSLALKRTYQELLPRLSAHWRYPRDLEAVPDWRRLFGVRHCLQIEMVIL